MDRGAGHAGLSQDRCGRHGVWPSLPAATLSQSWGHPSSQPAAQEESLSLLLTCPCHVFTFVVGGFLYV